MLLIQPGIFLFPFLLLLFFTYADVSAAVVINEIFYNAPSTDEKHEWVEVYNGDNLTYDLTNWKFFEGGTEHRLTVSLGSFVLQPDSYAVVADDAATFIKDYPSFLGTLLDSSFSLSNSGEEISFRDGASGTTVDLVNYSALWGLGSGYSLQRRSVKVESGESTNWASGSFGGSPGQANSFPTATPTSTLTPSPTPSLTPGPTAVSTYPSGIFLSEFMANAPTGEKEWVEIYNSGSERADLRQWQIDDGEGGSSAQIFSVLLPAAGFYQINLTGSRLNNDGDAVRLLRPDQSVADMFRYPGSHKGVTWAKDKQGKWLETSLATPNEENRFEPVGGPPHRENIQNLKKLTFGSKVELEAAVSAPPGVFAEKEMYVVDNTSGIKISFEENPGRKAQLGDRVRVSSTLEESYLESYIKTQSYTVLEASGFYPDPREVRTGEIAEDNEGLLVKTRGRYRGAEGDSFYLDDGSGRAKIYLKESTGISKLKMEREDLVEVQGIISQHGKLDDGQPNFRLMPRYQGDLRNLTQEEKVLPSVLGLATELPRTGAGAGILGIFLLIGGILLRVVVRCRGWAS